MSPTSIATTVVKTVTSGYMPDLLLGFCFFSSLSLATLRQRFEHRNAAIGLSLSLGMALAIGLTWWEHEHQLSVRDLGSIGIILAMLVLTMVVIQSLRRVGSDRIAGILTLVLILTFVAYGQHIDLIMLKDLFYTILLIGVIVAAVKLLSYGAHRPAALPSYNPPTEPDWEIKRLHRDRALNQKLDKQLRSLKNEADLIKRDPNQGPNVLQRITALLPAEGYLTQRMARLRKKAYQVCHGHIARLKETKVLTRLLSAQGLARASRRLMHSYHDELRLEKHLTQLDQDVATNEKRIVELLRMARTYCLGHRFKEIPDLIKEAERLQHHNARLFKQIERYEHKLSHLATRIAREQTQQNKEVKSNDRTE